MNKQITQRVQNHYNSIYPKCDFYDSCKGKTINFPDNPKMSYIGRDYGNNPNIPNVLFLSLDSGETQPKYSTINEIRYNTEIETNFNNTTGKNKGKHWFQTFNMAMELLKPFVDVNSENDVKPYIVHANSAKCNQGKEKRRQADDVLFSNCIGFVQDEIPLYEPNLVISQGKRAEYVLDKFPINETITIGCEYKGKNKRMNLFIRSINGKDILHIPMYHPSYYGGYWWKRQCVIKNITIIENKLRSILKENQLI